MTHLKDWKTGVSSSCFPIPTPEVVHQYAQNGIDCMEISMRYDRYGDVDYPALQRAAQADGVTLWSIHLPFDNTLSIAHSDPSVRQASMALNTSLLRTAGEIGIHHAVIHPGTEPTALCDREERLRESRENLHTLAETADKMGITLCVEELPRTCPGNCAKEILYLLEASPKLRVCFDTNHLLLESHKDFLAAVGGKVATLHVSDYDFVDERHQLPGEGKIGWPALIRQLEEIGYDGPWMYELNMEPIHGRTGLRTLSLRDFKENHLALAAECEK